MLSSRRLDYCVWPVKICDDEGEEYFSAEDFDLFKVLSKKSVEVVADVDVEIYTNWMGDTSFTIPGGWLFDGASIPKVFWDVVGRPTDKKFLLAAAIHDWMYQNGLGRQLADDLFRIILMDNGVWCWRAATMWSAVRLFGNKYYNKVNKNVK